MKRLGLWAMVVMGAAFSAAEASLPVAATIALKESVSVDRDIVTLGDVADVRTGDDNVLNALLGVPLEGVPGVKGRIYSRTVLTTAIRRGMPAAVSLSWSGAEQVVVKRVSTTYDRSVFAVVAQEYLSRFAMQHDPAIMRLEINPGEGSESIQLPLGALSITPRSIRGSALSPRMCVWLDIRVDEKTYRSMPIWFSVRAYREVWVAKRRFDPRENISAGDFQAEERNVAEIRNTPVDLKTVVTSLRTTRIIPEGKILATGDVELAPAVVRNQEVEVQVTAGAVQIVTKAVAEQDGRIGDQISLRNLSSDKSFLAQVVGIGQTKVYVR